MTEKIVELLSNVPQEISVMIISMLPVSELRGAIPAGILMYKINPVLVYLLAVVGNLIPVVFILLLLEKLDNFLRKRSRFFAGLFDKIYTRTRKRGEHKIKKAGSIALVTIVAIPLPMTGAWTGSLLAVLLKIPFKKAFPLIALGVVIAGIIVSMLTLMTDSFFRV
ncbi:MAG: ligand-binding protein SH3 [Candidatus Moranbacteria bacterium]|nr:ligand-binding protein SH3 [Candidatus Moranbacteria bacterium]